MGLKKDISLLLDLYPGSSSVEDLSRCLVRVWSERKETPLRTSFRECIDC